MSAEVHANLWWTHEHTLRRVGVVQGGLNDVVGEGVSQELLQPASVQELANENLSQLGIGNSDALKGRQRSLRE